MSDASSQPNPFKATIGVKPAGPIVFQNITVTNVGGMWTVSLMVSYQTNAGETLIKAPTCTVYANNSTLKVQGMSLVAGYWTATITQLFPEPDAIKVDLVVMDASHTFTPQEAFTVL